MSGLTLGLLGSGEFEPWAAEADRWLLDRAADGAGPVLVVPTASAPEGDEVFDDWAARGLAHYEKLGVAAEVLPIKTRADADRSEHAERVQDAPLVFFSGGNPAYLAATLQGTEFWRALLAAMGNGTTFGGCSAGVACLAERAPDSAADEFGPDLWQPGLGLFRDAVLGPHWDALDSFVPGLTEFIVASVPAGCRLVGLDERTAMLGDGREWSVVGSGGAHVFLDGQWEHHRAGSGFDLDLIGPTRTA